MKNLIFALLITYSAALSAQCEYSNIAYNSASGETILKSKLITLDLQETPFKGRIILAYIVRKGNRYFVELEITEDSSTAKLEPICFETGSRISFMLKNGTTVGLMQAEEKICGIKSTDNRTGFTTVSNYGKFVITQAAFEELVKSEILMMKITAENYNKQVVIKDELKIPSENGTEIVKPNRIFIDNMKCLTNPKLE